MLICQKGMPKNILPLTILVAVIAFATACKKDKKVVDNKTVLTGGKGGPYSFALFPTYNTVGAVARVFCKYAANTKPSDTSQYDEKYNTMIEPGYGPHVHFNNIKTGTYYIFIQGGNRSADTVIQITESSPKNQDIYKSIK